MYSSMRAAQVRNVAIALINGAVTLVILLIAPLGLAAVIVNTLLVVVATYVTATIGDWVLRYVQADTPLRAELVDPAADPVAPSNPLPMRRPSDASGGSIDGTIDHSSER